MSRLSSTRPTTETVAPVSVSGARSGNSDRTSARVWVRGAVAG